MPWPSPQDYAEAIQSPRLSLSDIELQKGEVELNALGLPRCLSGAFATVFCLRCNGKKVAVRCFLSNVKEQEERYAEISKFVMSDDLPYTVAFEYLKKGILIRDEWFPILKMEWVEGETLGTYLERVREREALDILAAYFKQMTLELNRAGISHGDLQHDNILISDSEMRLVDYDGMFVPSLNGREATELGHRNYQHPKRGRSFFDSRLDNFSAWVIYISLKCLALDSSLWKRLDAGSDCLLFRQSDFAESETSQALEILDAHENEKIRRYAEVVRQLIAMPIADVPNLSTMLLDKVVLRTRKIHGGSGGAKDTSSAQPQSRFATDHEGEQVAFAEPEEKLPQLVASEKENQNPSQSLPAIIVPDAYYPSVSQIYVGRHTVGSFVDVAALMQRQLPKGETIKWCSSIVKVKRNRPPVLQMMMILTFGFFGMLAAASGWWISGLLAIAFVVGFYYSIPLDQTVYLLTNKRLIVTTAGIEIEAYSIPLTEIEYVRVRNEPFGATLELHPHTILKTPKGRLADLSFHCDDPSTVVRNLPQKIRVY